MTGGEFPANCRAGVSGGTPGLRNCQLSAIVCTFKIKVTKVTHLFLSV